MTSPHFKPATQDEDVEIDTCTVDQHIARLRRKLGSASDRISTVPNFGYQFRMK